MTRRLTLAAIIAALAAIWIATTPPEPPPPLIKADPRPFKLERDPLLPDVMLASGLATGG